MSGVDIVKTFIEAIEKRNIDEVKQHLSGNFVMIGWTAQPLNKNQFLNLIIALNKSIPDLTFEIRNLQEDNQFAQSDRVEGDMQVIGTPKRDVYLQSENMTSRSAESRMVSLSQGHVSFTIMGDIIESMVVAGAKEGELPSMITQQQQAEQGKEETGMLTRRGHSSHQGGDKTQRQEEYSDGEEQKRYNKQSNLYDPEGKSYTPSRNNLDYAPQVDTYSTGQQAQDNSTPYVFNNEQEQRSIVSRQPNREQEQQE